MLVCECVTYVPGPKTYQLNFAVLIQVHFIVVVSCVELFVGWPQFTTSNIVHLQKSRIQNDL